MSHSYAERLDVTCPHCDQDFHPDLYLIVDAGERPDLLERTREGTLQDLSCSHCHQAVGQPDAPLLFYRPGEDPPLLFSPAQRTTEEQNQQHVVGLVGRLRESMGDDWREEWVAEGLSGVPRHLLSAALSDDPEGALRQQMDQAAAELERLRHKDPEAYRRLEEEAEKAGQTEPLIQALQQFLQANTLNESQRVVEAHSELLSDEAETLLERFITAAREQNDADAEGHFTEHRDLLHRAREVGLKEAFAEKIERSPEGLSASEASAPVPPEVRQVLDELAASGDEIRSPEDLARRLKERPDLQERLEEALHVAGLEMEIHAPSPEDIPIPPEGK